MNNENPILSTREQLVAELEQAKLRLAFYDLQEEEIQAYAALAEKDESIAKMVNEQQASMLRLIRQKTKAQQAKSRLAVSLKAIKRVAMAASILITVAVLGMSTVFAFSPQMRVAMQSLLIRVTSKYTEIGLQNSSIMHIPEGWEGDYFPAYIPEGFHLVHLSCPFPGTASVQYEDAVRNRFNFDELSEGSRTNIDTENARVSYITVHDLKAMLVEKGGRVMITWAEFDRYFIITLYGSTDTALAIARSVRRIK